MAQRRMFSDKIVDTDAFLDMGIGSQLLYFHLSMRADDDGFVSNPKKIMRMIGAQEDDYKVLLAKKFVIQFESGVCVIKHWLIHNLIRGDRYTETQYIKEKDQLLIDEKTKKYSLNKEVATNVIPDGNQLAPQVRLGKVRLGKVREVNTGDPSSQISELIDAFKEVNPAYKKFFGNKTQRGASERLLKAHGLEKLGKIIKVLPQSNATPYMPSITTPLQLEDKFGQLASAWQKKKNSENIIL